MDLETRGNPVCRREAGNPFYRLCTRIRLSTRPDRRGILDRRTGHPSTLEGDPEDILDLEWLANENAFAIVGDPALLCLRPLL